MIGAIGFTTPWLLLGLLALPILWILLRAVPPAPVRRIFPGVVLLLGLQDDEQVSDRTPWWLLLLRTLAIAALIIGLAGPVLNPRTDDGGSGPLLVALDGGWASAADWTRRTDMVDRILTDAGRAGRPVALVNLSAPEAISFQAASDILTALPGLTPLPWEPTRSANDIDALLPEGPFDTIWLTDDLARDTRPNMIALFEGRGVLQIASDQIGAVALAPLSTQGAATLVTARRSETGTARDVSVELHGRDPAGNPALQATATIGFEAGAAEAQVELSLPAEMRARLTHAKIVGHRSAGAVTLSDDRLAEREVALFAGREGKEGLELLEPLHYLRQALAPNVELLEGSLIDVLPAAPDLIILADVDRLAPVEELDLETWVRGGGMLVRFAGPRVAASDISRGEEDPLMPVRLRAGGRTVGGAMSWGTPKALAPFTQDSPFFGLSIPDDVNVSSQVMAQPDPTLADRVIASLNDGTPLVTRKSLGDGQVVLFHVTANAEWSSLPLSGLFVDMLDRLADASFGTSQDAEDLSGTTWTPLQVLDGFGRLRDAGTLPGVAGDRLVSADLGPDLRPGLYENDGARFARNVINSDRQLEPFDWPVGMDIRPLTILPETPFGGLLMSLALALLLLDLVVSLALSGRLRVAAMLIGVIALPIQSLDAQQVPPAAAELALAYVKTGDARIDDTSHAGLRGLSQTLNFRTSIEPVDPVGVDLEQDELAFYPFLYWPVTPVQPTPSDVAYARLNAYLRSGGMILFDTRDADVARFGTSSPNGRKLQQLAAALDVPALEPVPEDHVLTRTFYLLKDFPGRHASRDVWVEAAPKDSVRVEGMPFRNLNDGVTPIVIGGNDWASAWAVDPRGNPQVPIGRGFAGERQRELAYRFGVNLVMHVLTGNYKSDQVHVPALLDRLGQ